MDNVEPDAAARQGETNDPPPTEPEKLDEILSDLGLVPLSEDRLRRLAARQRSCAASCATFSVER